MNLEMIETIRKLAETHDFKGVPIPQLCKMAARYAWLRDKSHEVADSPVMLDLDGGHFTTEDPNADSIDAAIDAAISNAAEGEGGIK